MFFHLHYALHGIFKKLIKFQYVVHFFVLLPVRNHTDLLLFTDQQTLDLMVRGKQDLNILGPRLNLTKEDKMSVRHGPDRRLNPIITPPMPLMEVGLILKTFMDVVIMKSVYWVLDSAC